MNSKIFTLIFLCCLSIITNAQFTVHSATAVNVPNSSGSLTTFTRVIDGKTYTTGISGAGLPTTNGSANAGSYDIYFRAHDAAGAIRYSVLIGGSGNEGTASFEVANGKVYLFFTTSSANLPVTNGSVKGAGTDVRAFFILNEATGATEFGTYIGGNNSYLNYLTNNGSLAIDGTDAILIGRTAATDFATTDGSVHKGAFDVFIRRYTASGTLVYSKLLGGTGVSTVDVARHVVTQGGFTYLLSQSPVNSFPVTDGSNTTIGAAGGLILTKLDAAGNIVFSKYILPVSGSSTNKLLADATGVYLVGSTPYDAGFPITTGSPYAGGGRDFFATKLDLNGNIVYSRYLGSAGSDNIVNETPPVLRNGELYITGNVSASGYPVVNGLPYPGGTLVSVLTKLNSSGGIAYSTHYNIGTPYRLDVVNGEAYLLASANGPTPTTDGTTSGMSALAKFTTTGKLCMSSLIKGDNDIQNHQDGLVFGDKIYTASSIQPTGTGTEYYVTVPYTTNNNGDPALTIFDICPPAPTVTTDPVTPATQTVCQNALVQQIVGTDIFLDAATNLPLIYNAGVPSPQNNIYFDFQWQSAPSATGPWTDIANATEKNYSPSPTTSSIYFRRITRQNECCGGGAIISTSDVSSVIVNASAAPTVDAGGATLGILQTCPGSPLNIGGSPSASGGTAPYTYAWNNGAGTTANPTVSPAASAIYTLTVTDATGCTQADQVVVNTYAANAGPDKGFCSGTPVQIGTAAPAGVTGITYAWALLSGNGTLSSNTVAQPTVSGVTIASVYEVTMTVAKSGGGTCSTTDQVTISPIAAPTPDFAGPDRVVCLTSSTTTLGLAPQVVTNYTLSAVSQSTVNVNTGTVANLNDNTNTTGASTTTATSNDWVQVDLGSINRVSQVELQAISTQAALLNGRTLQVSTDGITWTTIVTISGATDAALTTFRFAERDARYVRVLRASTTGGVSVAEFRVGLGYTYIWSPGTFISSTSLSTVTFNPGTVNMPTPNKITYTLTATANGCTFTDNVEVAVIEARAGIDFCGPRIIGEPDRTPGITETYAWSVVSGTPQFLGVTNQAQVPVGASVGTDVTYRLTTTYNLNGVIGTCTDDVVVPITCSQGCDIIVAAASGCASYDLSGGNVTFTAIPPGDPSNYSYSWSPAVGLTAYNTRSVNLTDNVQRTYTVTITSLLDPTWSCTATETGNNPIFATPVFNAPSPINSCSGAATLIGDPASNPGYTYAWTGAGLSATNVSQPTATSPASIDYTVTVTDNVTGCKLKDTVSLITTTAANAGPDKTVCDNGTVTLGSPAEAGYTYSWVPAGADWRNGTDQFSAQPDAFVAVNTTFTLTKTHTASSCVSTDATVVTVSPGIAPFIMSPLSYCPGGTALRLGYSNGTTGGTQQVPNLAGYTYAWSPAGLLSSPTTRNPTVNTPMPGTATTFTVVVTTAAGCNTIATQTITPTTAAVNAGADKTICLGAGTPIGSAANPTGGGEVYGWSPATGLSDPASPNPTFTPTAAGTFTFTVTKTVAGCATTDQVVITVSSAAIAVISPVTVCSGTSVIIGPATADASLTYLWSPSTGLSNPNIANPTATLTTTQTYTLTVTNSLGCQSINTVVVGVNPTPAPTVTVANVSACAGDAASFTAVVSPAGTYNYLWTPATNLSSATIANPTINTNVIATTTYSLLVTNTTTGCYNTATNITATVSPCPPVVVSLSGNVFTDYTNDNTVNGTGTGNPSGVPLYVSLIGPGGTVVASVAVNPDGTYNFPSVTGNTTYSVVLSTSLGITGNAPPTPNLPAGWANTAENLGTGTGSDGTTNGTLTPIAVGITNVTNANFGISQASIGDKVWRDDNKDGIQDVGEPGVAGITVTVYQNGTDGLPGTADDIVIGTTVTDAYGNYLFTNLPASTNAATMYNVGFTLPANYQFATQTNTQVTGTDNTTNTTTTSGGSTAANGSDANVSTGRTGSFFLTTGEAERGVDAGIVFNTPVATNSIGNRVWLDTDAGGDQDGNEPGVAGVTVTLYAADGVTIVATTVTDVNGNYLFTGLPLNTNYIVGVTPPAGTLFTTSGGTTTANDTDSDVSTTLGTPSYGKSAIINTGVAGTTTLTIDAGLIPQPTTRASLGDRVWYDNNRNGVQDPDEPGIVGVTVQLLAADGVTVLATTTTDAFGNYIFPNLLPGDYRVGFGPVAGMQRTTQNSTSGAIPDATDSDADVTTGLTAIYILVAGEKNMSVDAGYYSTQPAANVGALGDNVWNDLDGDGIQDANEPGVAGVTVTLYNSAGTAIATTTTDINGNYLFPNLTPGNYSVGFSNLPAGFGFTGQDKGGNDIVDSDANPATGQTAQVAVTGGTTNTTLDAGIRQGNNSGLGSLGDRVWYDLDNDGIQDAGELGVAGVTVTLLDAGADGIVGNGDDGASRTTTTNALGEYIFDGLPAGNYAVQFSNLPSGFTLSTSNAGANDGVDSDGGALGTGGAPAGASRTAVYNLAQGEDNLSVDLGLVPPASTFTLGGTAWFDTDKDGLQVGNPARVPGVTVTLYNSAGVAIGTTTTDENGDYLFAGLAVGSYSVGFSNYPSGYDVTSRESINTEVGGSDVFPLSGRTSPINLGPSNPNDRSLDVGLISPRAALGNYVWDDLNRDGIQDAGETPVAGVTVSLYFDTNKDGLINGTETTTPVATAITDADGKYFFSNLEPGNYQVGFTTLPSGMEFTTQDNTTGPNGDGVNTNGIGGDSDVSSSTGRTGIINLSPNEVDLTVDAGIRVNLPATIGNKVWADINSDGVQDVDEPGIAGVVVTLYNSSNQPIGSAITDGNGNWQITKVPSGTGYYVIFTSNLPNFDVTGTPGSNPAWTVQNIGANGTAVLDSGTESDNDSDVTVSGANNGSTGTFSIVPGNNFLNIDAGIINWPLNNILPIKLLSFTALPKGNAVSVDWNVENQVSVSKYEVLYSLDGIYFRTILANIAATSNTSEAYNILHSTVSQGINYYRIRTTEKDGTVSYSEIRKVNFGKAGTISVFPNPANTVINITLTGSLIDKAATMTLLSADGKVVSQNNIVRTGQTESINVSTLANGTYFIKVTTESEVIYRTIQVNR